MIEHSSGMRNESPLEIETCVSQGDSTRNLGGMRNESPLEIETQEFINDDD